MGRGGFCVTRNISLEVVAEIKATPRIQRGKCSCRRAEGMPMFRELGQVAQQQKGCYQRSSTSCRETCPADSGWEPRGLQGVGWALTEPRRTEDSRDALRAG